jgi:hypothetical protein
MQTTVTATTKKPLPPALPLRKLLGPSFLILALGLGSGEVILWPYLSANYGLGLAWGAVIGITFQFFINMEIERYALVRGESVFVGVSQIFKIAPYWFIVSTFIGFGLPGIISASASALSAVIDIPHQWIAIVMLLIMGVIISSGKRVYQVMERVTTSIIILSIPLLLIIVAMVVQRSDLIALAQGLIGYGPGYRFLPVDISLATFLAAFAYSGAGGNLNLTQSIYIREKGYGMGVYAQKLSGFIHSFKGAGHVKLQGTTFAMTPKNLAHFKQWWHRVNIEHAIVFWGIGLFSILLLMLLSYATAYGIGGNQQGIHFVINQALVIGQEITPIVGTIFLLMVSVMLFQTQLGIIDSTSRIMSENAAIIREKRRAQRWSLSHIYAFFVWAQIAFGIIVITLGFSEPKTLIVLGAVINAVAMLVHIIAVNWTNYRLLPKEVQPRIWRRVIIVVAGLFFSGFSLLLIIDALTK